MSTTKLYLRMTVIVGLLAVCGTGLAGEPFSIDWFTIDAGGGYNLGGEFELEATIGQHDTGGPMTGGGFELMGGFWSGAGETVVLPGDCDGDGHVALDDYADFVPCMLGPAGTVGEDCNCYDLTGDSHVDLRDGAELFLGFTGK